MNHGTTPIAIRILLLPVAFASLLLFSSCGTQNKGKQFLKFVRKYPPNTPFVYSTEINVIGADRKTTDLLESRLKNQLDDSLQAKTLAKPGWTVLKNPPVYRSENAEKSVRYMRALLNSMGYFRDTITYDTTVVRIKRNGGDQLRTIVTFNVIPGKVVKVDSFTYNFKDPTIQQIALANQEDAQIRNGDPFAKASISAELDRLVNLYRDSGYLRFGREVLIGLWDTLDVSLLRPTVDPIEQLEILEKLRLRRLNPTASLEIRFKPGFDSTKLTKYYVGNTTIYPDFGIDTTGVTFDTTLINDVKVISYRDMFRPRIFPQYISFRKGQQYSQTRHIRTINRFNSIGTWRVVSIEAKPRNNTDTADFEIKLTPESKYSFTLNVEGSRNSSVLSGNLFGIGANASLTNRNFLRSAYTSTTSIRYGIEISDSSFIQTQQFAINHVIYFPRMLPRINWIPQRSIRTSLSLRAENTERKDLFNLTTFNTSWGYEIQKRKTTFLLRLPNIEYSYLKPRPKLLNLFNGNPALKNVFTDGLISSVIFGVIKNGSKEVLPRNAKTPLVKNIQTVFRSNVELSGMVSGLVNNKFLDTNLYRFIRVDAELIKKLEFNKSALVLRAFAGVGYEFENTANPNKRNNLPFFKQYFAGGPESMRAWGLRKLGRGSSIESFNGPGSTPERYGDVKLEGNIEYRFPMFKPFGIKVNGALFTDVGNIWFLKKDANPSKPNEVFDFSRLGKDLAVGVGIGFRLDFDFFVVRLDYSYKAKDPSPSPANAARQNKWFSYPWFKGDQLQLGLSYPFIL